MSQATTKK